MQFQVPQFLEVEDKIFGFLTFKQFLYLAGGIGTIYVAYAYLPFFGAVLFGFFVLPFVISLAFLKVNNKPFVHVVESFLRYISSSRLYIWKKIPKKIEKKEIESKKNQMTVVPRLTESKLKELAWTLDIKSPTAGGGNMGI